MIVYPLGLAAMAFLGWFAFLRKAEPKALPAGYAAPSGDPTTLAQRVAQNLKLGPTRYDKGLLRRFQAAAYSNTSGLYDADTKKTLETYGAFDLPPPFVGPKTGGSYLPMDEGDDLGETLDDIEKGIKIATPIIKEIPFDKIISEIGDLFGGDDEPEDQGDPDRARYISQLAVSYGSEDALEAAWQAGDIDDRDYLDAKAALRA